MSYMIAAACATELRLFWSEEQALATATMTAALSKRDLDGRFIFGSGVWVVRVGATPRPLGVIGREF
jgi:hypothetical protein